MYGVLNFTFNATSTCIICVRCLCFLCKLQKTQLAIVVACCRKHAGCVCVMCLCYAFVFVFVLCVCVMCLYGVFVFVCVFVCGGRVWCVVCVSCVRFKLHARPLQCPLA